MRAITCWVSCPDPMTKVGDTRWDFRCRRRWITTRSRRPIGIKMLAQTQQFGYGRTRAIADPEQDKCAQQ